MMSLLGRFSTKSWKDRQYKITLFRLHFGKPKEDHMRVPGWVLRIVGKKMVDGELEKVGFSKAKLTAILYILITAIQTIGPAFGHPITIPPEVFRVLEALGLWAVRDAIKS